MPLLEDVKNYLDITWDDEATDKKLLGILERGQAYLQNIAGATLDFVKEEQPRSLLFDYARYARSNALEAFPSQFREELNALYIESMGGISTSVEENEPIKGIVLVDKNKARLLDNTGKILCARG